MFSSLQAFEPSLLLAYINSIRKKAANFYNFYKEAIRQLWETSNNTNLSIIFLELLQTGVSNMSSWSPVELCQHTVKRVSASRWYYMYLMISTQVYLMTRIAAWNWSLTLEPYSWVLTTITDPLLTLSDGKPFLNRATSLYTLPVLIPETRKYMILRIKMLQENLLEGGYQLWIKILSYM